MSVEYLDKVLADTGSRVFAKFNRKESENDVGYRNMVLTLREKVLNGVMGMLY